MKRMMWPPSQTKTTIIKISKHNYKRTSPLEIQINKLILITASFQKIRIIICRKVWDIFNRKNRKKVLNLGKLLQKLLIILSTYLRMSFQKLELQTKWVWNWKVNLWFKVHLEAVTDDRTLRSKKTICVIFKH